MPFAAKPSARSRNGLFGPMVSSRSFGPEPWTSTTTGGRTVAVGTSSVAGNGHPGAPVTSASSRTPGGSGRETAGGAGAGAEEQAGETHVVGPCEPHDQRGACEVAAVADDRHAVPHAARGLFAALHRTDLRVDLRRGRDELVVRKHTSHVVVEARLDRGQVTGAIGVEDGRAGAGDGLRERRLRSEHRHRRHQHEGSACSKSRLHEASLQ